jgi:transcriptional regulator with XRE-family HTH domain
MAAATKAQVRRKPKPVPAHRQKQAVGNALGDLRRRHGLSQALLARMLDVSLRTLSGAESAATVPPRMRRSVTQAARLCDALGEAMQPAFVGQWLDQPNEMIGNLKPVEAIERGQADLVWQVVEGLRSGSQL